MPGNSGDSKTLRKQMIHKFGGVSDEIEEVLPRISRTLSARMQVVDLIPALRTCRFTSASGAHVQAVLSEIEP